MTSLKIGDKAPEFEAKDNLGNTIKLSDYIGKKFTGDDLPPKVIYTSRAHDWSTTKLKNDITIQTLRDNKELLLKQPELLNKIKNLKDKI